MEMSEETKAKLRGRPKNAPKQHTLLSNIEQSRVRGDMVGVKHSRGYTLLIGMLTS